MLLLIAGLGTASAQSADGVLAFPGADGFGKYTTGGRGGEVYYVTTTEDCTDSNLKERLPILKVFSATYFFAFSIFS